jgi:hypothetical protein
MIYTREEIQKFVDGMNEGKSYSEIVDELYPTSEYECMYQCALENMRSFSLIKTIYNYLTKKAQPALRSCEECLTCVDCIS